MDVNLEGRGSCQLFVLVLEVAVDEHESIVQTLELAGDVESHAVLDETSEAICMFVFTHGGKGARDDRQNNTHAHLSGSSRFVNTNLIPASF